MSKTLLVLIAACSIAANLCGQEAAKPKPAELTPEQAELVALIDEMNKASSDFYAAARNISDPMEQERFFEKKDPALTYVPKLEEFEKKHHGEYIGLMAARRLTLLGVGGGMPDNPRDMARRNMLPTLADYAAFEELPEILRYFDTGNFEPAVEPCLRAIIASPRASEQNRLFAKQMLAEWAISCRQGREYVERRAKAIGEGAAQQWPKEAEWLKVRLASMLPAEKIAELDKEAINILTELSELKTEIRQPAITNIDPKYHLIKIDPEVTKTRPLISEMASGLLFKENHLRTGKDAPELNLTLVSNDKPWSLADQKGKAVIIQFSFKGCGPCEEMYPDLRELAEKYKDKISIVSIMADETREVSLESHTSGKMPWNVHFDGVRGPIATRWAVRGFPTVYVISPDGKIAAEGPRGEQLKAKIAELCK